MYQTPNNLTNKRKEKLTYRQGGRAGGTRRPASRARKKAGAAARCGSSPAESPAPCSGPSEPQPTPRAAPVAAGRCGNAEGAAERGGSRQTLNAQRNLLSSLRGSCPPAAQSRCRRQAGRLRPDPFSTPACLVTVAARPQVHSSGKPFPFAVHDDCVEGVHEKPPTADQRPLGISQDLLQNDRHATLLSMNAGSATATWRRSAGTMYVMHVHVRLRCQDDDIVRCLTLNMM